MVVFDATFLVALLNDKARNSIPDGHARVEYLVQELDKAREVIVVPTPALSEVPVGAKAAAPAYLQILKGSAYFRIVPFDDLAAVEAAAQTAAAMAAGDKMSGVINGWQKVKFDRMIVAIAAVTGCGVIYSDDPDLRKLAGPSGPQVISLAQLPVPPIPAQSALDFEGGAES